MTKLSFHRGAVRWIALALFLFACSLVRTAAAVEMRGPAEFNVDVPAGQWKAIRVRNLPRAALVAAEIDTDGEVTVVLVDEDAAGKLPDLTPELFRGAVETRLSFSVKIPRAGDYLLIVDNRVGDRTARSVQVKLSAGRGDDASARRN